MTASWALLVYDHNHVRHTKSVFQITHLVGLILVPPCNQWVSIGPLGYPMVVQSLMQTTFHKSNASRRRPLQMQAIIRSKMEWRYMAPDQGFARNLIEQLFPGVSRLKTNNE